MSSDNMMARRQVHGHIHLEPVADEGKRRLAYAIRSARVLKGLTAHELASQLGVVPTTVYSWEKGEKVPSLLMLGPLCEALGVSPDLFADLPEAPPSPIEAYLVPEAQQGAREGARRAARRRPR